MPKAKNTNEKLLASIREIVKEEINMKLSNMEVATAVVEPKQEEVLKTMEVTTGKIIDKDAERERLQKALRMGETNPFGTTDFEAFQKKLDTMSMAGLQDLAQKVGINPYEIQTELKKSLNGAFLTKNKQAMTAMRTPQKVNNVQLNASNPKHVKVMQMLGMKV